MFVTSPTVRYLECIGYIENFRINAPGGATGGSFYLGKKLIWVEFGFMSAKITRDQGIERLGLDNKSLEHELKTLLTNAEENTNIVRVGLFETKRGEYVLQWIISDGNGFSVDSRNGHLRNGWKKIIRWTPWFVLSTGAAWYCFDNTLKSVFFPIAGTVIGGTAVLITGIMLVLGIFEIGYALTKWKLIKKLELGLRRQLERKDPEKELNEEVSLQNPAIKTKSEEIESILQSNHSDESEPPYLHRITGLAKNVSAHKVKVGGKVPIAAGGNVAQVDNSIEFRCFEFEVSGLLCSLYSFPSNRGGFVFISENDRVEIIVRTDNRLNENDRCLIWAMRNLEDGRSYACHKIMSGAANPLASPMLDADKMSMMTPSSIRQIELKAAVFFFITYLLLVPITYFANKTDALPAFAGIILSVTAIFLLSLEALRYWWIWRFSTNRMSKRQRLTKRVYNLLQIGSPLVRAKNVFYI